MEMNADDSIPVDYIRTAFEMHRFHICSLDFIRQNTNRIRQSYRIDWRLDLCLWLRGDLVLDFWMEAISHNTLQQVARDNFSILKTLKVCLLEAS